MSYAQRILSMLSTAASAGASTGMAYPKVTFRDINQWSTFVEDCLDKRYLQDSASWRTCNKGTVIVFEGKTWAQWDRATSSGWAYNLKEAKPVDTTEMDLWVEEIKRLEFEVENMRQANKRSAFQELSQRLADLKSQVYVRISETPQPERQGLAVRYQELFAPRGDPTAGDGNPEVERYHKGLGTYWEPYASPFGFSQEGQQEQK